MGDVFTANNLGYAFLGGSAAFFFMMIDPLSHFELYGEFLMTFAIGFTLTWWYPIYMRGKENG